MTQKDIQSVALSLKDYYHLLSERKEITTRYKLELAEFRKKDHRRRFVLSRKGKPLRRGGPSKLKIAEKEKLSRDIRAKYLFRIGWLKGRVNDTSHLMRRSYTFSSPSLVVKTSPDSEMSNQPKQLDWDPSDVQSTVGPDVVDPQLQKTMIENLRLQHLMEGGSDLSRLYAAEVAVMPIGKDALKKD